MRIQYLDAAVLIIAVEALTELFFKAGPLDCLRHRLRNIEWLDTKNQGHLADCPYCVSVWMALIVWGLYLIFPYVLYPLALHRAANYLHMVFSWLRDKQINLRLQRLKEEYNAGNDKWDF